jgi:ABC-2 type transport system ATP-binding protein
VATTIAVEGVAKRFRRYHERYSSFKERAIHFGRIPYDDFYALRDIDIDVQSGETVGLLGHNGSGKSTLLKCIAGILQPTTGRITTVGRLAALLELGAGFHPDLTGRENVFLNAAVLGLSRRETARRFDEIVAFAELEEFIDNQVKHYSSGMYVRLGFAVAVNMDPEILLVDEVLAVGDEAFQRKCLDRVRQFQREGRTILFVTHAPDLVRQICDRVAVLERGRLVAYGPPGESVRVFREHLLSGGLHPDTGAPAEEVAAAESGDEALTPGALQERKRNLKVRITGVTFEHPGTGQRPYLLPGEPLAVRIAFDAVELVDDVVFGIGVYDLEGRVIFGSNTDFLDCDVGPLRGAGAVRFDFASVPLLDGTYLVTLGIHSHDEGTVYDWHEQRHQFEVMNPGRSAGLVALPLQVEVAREEAPAREQSR